MTEEKFEPGDTAPRDRSVVIGWDNGESCPASFHDGSWYSLADPEHTEPLPDPDYWLPGIDLS